MTDGHYARYQEMLDKVDWNKYGVVNGVARDPRCENCMVHCGYDPSGALGTNYQRGDNWKNIRYNFARPAQALLRGPPGQCLQRRSPSARAISPKPRPPSTPAWPARNPPSRTTGTTAARGGACGSGDTSQRDELLAKVRAAKKA